MSGCDQYRLQVQLFFDNELRGQEFEDFQGHLPACRLCRDCLREEQALSNLLRESRPLYSAPSSLRIRMMDITNREPARFEGAPDRLRRRISRLLGGSIASIELPVPGWRALAATMLFAAIALTFLPHVLWHVRAASYANTAVATHLSYVGGRLPLEIQANAPEAVERWFSGKVPFDFRLPASQPSADRQPVYRLEGARLVNYRGSYAALVVYKMKSASISLLVAPESLAPAAGGDEVRSGELTFHYHVKDGLNVITWSNHGLTYALVSSVQGPAQRSCLVCHQDMADHDNFSVKK